MQSWSLLLLCHQPQLWSLNEVVGVVFLLLESVQQLHTCSQSVLKVSSKLSEKFSLNLGSLKQAISRTFFFHFCLIWNNRSFLTALFISSVSFPPSLFWLIWPFMCLSTGYNEVWLDSLMPSHLWTGSGVSEAGVSSLIQWCQNLMTLDATNFHPQPK